MKLKFSKKSLPEIFIFIVAFAMFLGNLWEIKALALAFKYLPPVREPVYFYIREYTSVSLAAAFHSGLADFAINFIKGTTVCRHRNIFKAVLRAMDSNLDTFYVISDFKHLRTYVNGTVIDVVQPSYKMDPIIIEKCTIQPNVRDYFVECVPIYVKLDFYWLDDTLVVYDENESQIIQDILKKAR